MRTNSQGFNNWLLDTHSFTHNICKIHDKMRFICNAGEITLAKS